MKSNVLSRRIVVAIAALTLAGGAQCAALAGSITIFNTGVDASGTPQPNGTIGDLHYTLADYSITAAPGGTTTLLVLSAAHGFPIGPWLGDDGSSAWIGPNNTATVDGPIGTYDYQTTFDLTGFAPGTARLGGVWATDNSGLDILINGASTGNTAPGFTAFTPFTISSGFIAGLNTLDFIVGNAGGPTGLRVEVSGTASVVPEPASLVLFGAGFAGLCMLRRRLGWAGKMQ